MKGITTKCIIWFSYYLACESFKGYAHKQSKFAREVSLRSSGGTVSSSFPLNFEDMRHLEDIFTKISKVLSIEERENAVMPIVSGELGFLLSRNITGLTQMMLDESPQLRTDYSIQQAFIFVMNFMEVVAETTYKMVMKHQNMLKLILEAAKQSEQRVDEVLQQNHDDVCSSDFLTYLDSEIENLNTEGPDDDPGVISSRSLERMLVTLRLRVLDEKGRSYGLDVMELPKLAAEDDSLQRREKTLAHIEGHGAPGRELLLQTIRIMNSEMGQRYELVDATLQERLKEIEDIIAEAVEDDQRNQVPFK